MVEGAQERGYLEPAELEAFAVELDLNDEDIEELTAELERIGLEISTPAAAAAAEAEKERRRKRSSRRPKLLRLRAARPTASSSSSRMSASTSLLTAADEVMLAKAIERGDPRAKRQDDRVEPAACRLDREGLSRPGRFRFST